jgi:UPF0716 protein FxsA
MNVAKCLLLAVLALPVMELAAFIAVAAAIGVVPALALIAVGSATGALILRHAGGNHIRRMRTALGANRLSALEADGIGSLTLIAGILLLIPGFITDALGLVLLLVPLRRGLDAAFGRGGTQGRGDGVVDLPPEQWHRVADPELPDGRDKERE